jgi:hypothetical protein
MIAIEMFNQTVAIGAAVSGSVFSPKCKFNEDGIVQVSMSTSCTVSLQGRATPLAPWVNIRLTPAGDISFTGSGYGTIPLFPEMRVNITGGAAASAVVVWLLD